MAKYVGKIFNVKNSILGIRRRKTHNCLVEWFNPKTKKFRCRIITSLEDQVSLENEVKESILSSTPYHKVDENVFNLFKLKKYNKLRDGKITPIPQSQLLGTTIFHGFEKTVDLSLSQLRKSKLNKQLNFNKK